MYSFSIGAMVDSFRCDHATAMKKAALMGVKGIQVYATSGAMAPENMTDEKIREYKELVASNGLVISALCGDLGHGFADKERNAELIERSKRIVDLAKKLGTDIVTTHIGKVPEDTECETYKVMQSACSELAGYADSCEAHFAIETGPEKSALLASFLDTLGSTGVAVNLDPANLVMCSADDPVQAVYNLKRYIVHTHAKDGIMLDKPVNGRTYLELPLGQGGVDFRKYLKALDDIGYHGFLTIEREVGDDPAGDIGMAAEFLKKLIAESK